MAGRRVSKGILLLSFLVVAIAGLWAGMRWHEPLAHWVGPEADEGAPPAAEDEGHSAGTPQLWTCGMHPQVLQDKPGICPICHMKLEPVSREAMGRDRGGQPQGERKVAYWWDPMMNPPYIADRPGKSPMGMDLIPVYEDEVRRGAAVVIDPLVVQNMGIRVAEVEEGPVRTTVRSVGILKEAEPRRRDVTLKVQGWIEKLHADTEGMFLRKGEPLFEVYSPALLVAQEELISTQAAWERLTPESDEAVRRSIEQVLGAARRKLALWDVAEEEVVAIAQEGKARRTIAFRSPMDGFLTDKMVVEGAAVEPGMQVLRIVDHSKLWLDAQIYEEQLPSVMLGQTFTATVKALPGRSFTASVVLILPRIEASTRTVPVRVELDNPDFALKPGMYAVVEAEVELAPRAILAPREAVIETGVRQVAFIAKEGGRFEPRDVRLGVETSGGLVQVLEGLAPGDIVVTSGQFLLDVESRMREAIQKMLDERLLSRGAKSGQKPAAAGPKAEASPAVRARVDGVVAAYLEIAGALAQDDAVKAGPPLKDVLEATKSPPEGPGHARHLLAAVNAAAQGLDGKPLEEQRKAFKALSDAVIALVDAIPPSETVAARLYVLHCPMVPADWLQAEEEVANPYYGASMLRCGDVARTVEGVR